MIKKLFIILTLISFFKISYSQNNNTYLKEHAVPINKFDSLNMDVYDLIKNYRLIMIGEIHGTNEPVNLLDGLVSLLTNNGDSVQVGFEIPTKQMTSFIKQRTGKSILKTEFFANPSGDGRASIAWYNTLAHICKNKRVEIFFFDMNINQSGEADSLMYLNIKSNIQKHPKWKTITISGNVHNMILPIEGQKKTGNFLMLDKDLNMADKLCSLNFEYESGETLWDELKAWPSIYSKLGYNKYLFLYSNDTKESYHGIFFTKYLTKSGSAVAK